MEQITGKEILEATGGRLLAGDGREPLFHLSIDSRSMRGGDLFIPLIGEKTDGHRYLLQAMENGARAALTCRHETAPEGFAGTLIRVKDTKRALQEIGVFLRRRLSIPLVGVTGSVGKTTTREMVAAALSAGFRTFRTPANHNSQIGVPLTLSEIAKTDEIGVLELGMSEPGEMEIIARMAAVDTAIITNIGVTHIENLGSRENILREKLHIQDGMKDGGVLFLNGDNDLLREVTAREGLATVRYGCSDGCAYRAEAAESTAGGCTFTLVCEKGRFPVRLSVPGSHNVSNALAALAAADHYGVPLPAAIEALGRFTGVKNRQQIVSRNGLTIIDDTYNASPDSVKAGLSVLASLPATRRIAVLADMKELGEHAEELHREVGRFLASQPVDLLVTFGSLARGIEEGAKEAASPALSVVSFSEADRASMEAFLREELRAGDAVLFKGSNSMRLGTAAALFTGEEAPAH